MMKGFKREEGRWLCLDDCGWKECHDRIMISELDRKLDFIPFYDGDREGLLSKYSPDIYINVKARPRAHKPEQRERFRALCIERGIHALYHFTDRTNARSILQHGLYSWFALGFVNISPCRPGGNDLSRGLDQRYQLEDYVRLCFNPYNHPMLNRAMFDGRIVDPVFLEIRVDVVWWSGTRFSYVNATDGLAGYIGQNVEDLAKCRTEICLSGSHTTREEAKLYQAEVLVKTHILSVSV